jgi:hypothetical protein
MNDLDTLRHVGITVLVLLGIMFLLILVSNLIA